MVYALFARAFREHLHSNRALYWFLHLGSWFVLAFMVHLTLFAYFEGVAWTESLWVTWQTFTTVGYGDAPATTLEGRAVTMLVSTMGIALLGAVFTAAIDVTQNNREKRRFGLMKNAQRDGYVIINYPGEHSFASFVHEVRGLERDVPVCLVDSRLEELPASLATLPSVHFVKGSILDPDTYEKARIGDQKVVIVFPMDPYVPASDGTTRTIIDIVERYLRDGARVLHVLVDPRNAWLFKGTRSTTILENMEILVAVQECQDPHSAALVETLFRNTEGPSPATVAAGALAGATWWEFVAAAARTSAETGVAVTPVALIRDGHLDFAPAADAKLREGDLLSVVMNDAVVDWASHQHEIRRRLGGPGGVLRPARGSGSSASR